MGDGDSVGCAHSADGVHSNRRNGSDERDQCSIDRPTRRRLLGLSGAALATALAGCPGDETDSSPGAVTEATTATDAQTTASDGDSGEPEMESVFEQFVDVDGTEFVVDGETHYPVGGNHPQLRKQPRAQQEAWLEEWLDAVPELNVLRATAFGSGTERDTDPLQPSPGDHSARAFRKLDRLIALCGEAGVRLILPLTNFWDWQGGIPQYVEWSDGAETKEDFYTDEQCQEWYREHVEYVLTRTNAYTGVEYRNDPTIMQWELCNEPRGGADFRQWVSDTAEFIKSVDSNHLVSTGMDGSVSNTAANRAAHDADAVDAYSLHLWANADHTGIGVDGGVRVVRENAAAARDLEMPIYMGEFGWDVDRTDDVPDEEEIAERNRVFRAFFLAMREEEFGGSLVWDLRHSAEFPLDWNAYGVFPRDEGTSEVVQDAYESFDAEPDDEERVDTEPPAMTTSSPEDDDGKSVVVENTGGGTAEAGAFSLEPDGETYTDPDGDADGTDAGDVSADVYLGYDADNLYLRTEVTDDTHVATSGESLWQGDSLQWAVGTEATYGPEYGLSHADGDASLVRWIDGEAAVSASAVDASTSRDGDATTYEATVPWEALFSEPRSAGDSFPFSVLLNDSDADDDERDSVLGWTLPGIDDEKSQSALGTLVLADDSATWATRSDGGPYLVTVGERENWTFRVSNHGTTAHEFDVTLEGADETETITVPGNGYARVTVERAFGATGSNDVALQITNPQSGETRTAAQSVMVVDA